MVPPTGPLNLDVEAISGICGSISIACWVVVFSPQIIENFRRGNADGLSLQFIIVWLAGDVFNILGSVLQGVLPTMIILAVYYTIADIVLLGQCFYYRGFTWRDEVARPSKAKKNKRRTATAVAAVAAAAVPDINSRATERSALLAKAGASDASPATEHHHTHPYNPHERRGSSWSGLSPAVPFVADLAAPHHGHHHHHHQQQIAAAPAPATRSRFAAGLRAAAFNIMAMLMVCAAGVAGWYLSGGSQRRSSGGDDSRPPTDAGGGGDDSSGLVMSVWGQVFGYLCAALYLGSRLPQLLLNWRRQSTEGVSMLFFLFACLGNLTYVLSIFAFDGCSGSGSSGDDSVCDPGAARRHYGRYLLVNLSWLAGSLGTLLLDMGIFVQFFLYRVADDDDDDDLEDTDDDAEEDGLDAVRDEDEDEDEEYARRWDQRPLLQRGMSNQNY